MGFPDLVPASSPLGRVLRWPLGYIPPETQLRVLSGPSRGHKWIAGAGVHGYWLGWYELERQREICRLLKRGDTAYDVGAHVGFFTLLMARLVGAEGHVHAFEPDARNLDFLARHVQMNGYRANVTIHSAAVSDHTGSGSYTPGPNSSTGRLAPGGMPVQVVALDDVTPCSGYPSLIKVDVEGHEVNVLRGMERIRQASRPHVIVEWHVR
jgi:FkbM family methyltransferase